MVARASLRDWWLKYTVGVRLSPGRLFGGIFMAWYWWVLIAFAVAVIVASIIDNSTGGALSDVAEAISSMFD